MKTLVRGGRVIDPAQALDAQLDVLIENGVVARIAEHIDPPDAHVVDATGAVVAALLAV